MKNLIHAMRDTNITDILKASIFYLDENFTRYSRWLGRGSEHLISHWNLEEEEVIDGPVNGRFLKPYFIWGSKALLLQISR